ncbi:MAG: hypothetical protein M3Z09_10945 [Acidobacteriota bacterium]|nr:hypothetical protein [Acidobacteriota bacterium]
MRLPKLAINLIPTAVAVAGLSGSYLLPLDHGAIQYAKSAPDDAVAHLQQHMDSGAVKLEYEDEFGYLRSALKALKVPLSSQVLVFSKTSFQAPRIGPRTPRALYFNDNVQVGFVRTGEVLEFAALDPKQGIIFYTLDQEKSAKPSFVRRDTCLQCHQSGGTLGVPGLVVRSVFPDNSGMPLFQAGTFVTDHRSALKERWGGWYVTGTTGSQIHMGNAFVTNPGAPENLSADGTNVTDLRNFVSARSYLTPHSDVVALMTLEHQTQMVNLITRVGWETRLALFENDAINKALNRPATEISDSVHRRIDNAVEELLSYMLFREEIPLTGPVTGTSGFAEQFSKAGLHDAKGRSLRDFDMRTRMFRYPCSYMIDSDAFHAMAEAAKVRAYQRLYEILTGKDQTKLYAKFAQEDRQAIREILLDTEKDLPPYWRSGT